MRSISEISARPDEEAVAAEWRTRARRAGLARVMRASQPPELNAGVTDTTQWIVTDFLDRAARTLSRPLRSALEVGCGIGRLTPTIAEQCELLTAIDMTPEMLEEAMAACAGLPNVEFHRRRAQQLTAGESRFDVTVCVWVLMHLLDAEQLASVCRALAASSRYLVLVEYEAAELPVSPFSRLRSLEEYLRLLPGARLVETRYLDYGGDRSFAALIGFGDQDDE